MRIRLGSLGEKQFQVCVKSGLWGSERGSYRDWQIGDYLILSVDRKIAGVARIVGSPFLADDLVWSNGLFPSRIAIEFVTVLDTSRRVPIEGEIRDILISLWGPKYGWGILAKKVIDGLAAERIFRLIEAHGKN